MKDITMPSKKLGFGLMRLPLKEDGVTIDTERTAAMADEFLKKGFTYFDTAYGYHGGESERALKKAVIERHPRESFTVATKLPAWMIKEKADVDKIFNDQLEKTGAGYFDYYLLHAVSKDKLDVYDGFDCWNYCLEKKKEGKIKHFGFSFHDTAAVLDEILTNHPEAEFVQLQLNYLDWDNDAVQAKLCYEVAEKHNMPVIVMEPVKGGTLARLPESVDAIFKAKSDASAASWAIRFAASQKNVFMVLSGMSDEAQMNDNIATMEDFQPLSECEIETVNKAVEEYKSFNTVPCTACRYCTDGCPVSIRIPDIISALNQAKVYGLGAKARGMFEKAVEGAGNPADCISCGQCSAVCPQHLDIPSIMKEASEKFAKKEN